MNGYAGGGIRDCTSRRLSMGDRRRVRVQVGLGEQAGTGSGVAQQGSEQVTGRPSVRGPGQPVREAADSSRVHGASCVAPRHFDAVYDEESWE